MAKVTFIGNSALDSKERPDEREKISAFGHDFVKGQPVDVTDAAALAKFEGNSHFEVQKAAPKKAAPKKADADGDQG